jgi:hypothetical protein
VKKKSEESEAAAGEERSVQEHVQVAGAEVMPRDHEISGISGNFAGAMAREHETPVVSPGVSRPRLWAEHWHRDNADRGKKEVQGAYVVNLIHTTQVLFFCLVPLYMYTERERVKDTAYVVKLIHITHVCVCVCVCECESV